MIPVLNVGATYIELKDEIDAAISRVLASGYYIGGSEVTDFEDAFADYTGAAHCVGVGNGLDALALGLRALDVGYGDEVIVPSNTYIASWLAVNMVGATPVPVEPDPLTHCIDPELIIAAITSKTRAIMPVHLYGHPCAMDRICDIARDYGLSIIEDAAQAHGAIYDGKKIGSHGDIVAWSFYPTKNLGAFGDGGAITTNNKQLAEKIQRLRNYGSEIKNVNDVKGVNSRLDPVQAAVLRIKLSHLDDWQERRVKLASRYIDAFAELPIICPADVGNSVHAWHLFVIQSEKRDKLAELLHDSGIATAVHYPLPPHRQKAFAEFADRPNNWPIADQLAKEILSIPMGPHMTEIECEQVISAVHATSARL
jgi:dTDP-4-amino-4,6-dideoxygalactose transaminase